MRVLKLMLVSAGTLFVIIMVVGVLAVLFGAEVPDDAGPVITESEMGRCLEKSGMSPWDAGSGDVTVTYRQDGKTSVNLTRIGGVVQPLDSGDIRIVRLRGCDR